MGRVFVLAWIVWFVIAVFEIGGNMREHRERNAARAADCRSSDGPLRVRVSRDVVRHARRQGWPQVLRVGGARTGDVVAYDHGPAAEQVRIAIMGLCEGQSYQLRVR